VKPIWSSEIEKFPLALTKVRFPETIQLGDVTKIDGAKIPPVNIICSGSPCQSLSVAGKREGLKGESGLFFYTTDIIRRMRDATDGKYPRFLCWENVPGALNSSGGNDFRAVLEAIAETEIPMPANNKWANAGMVQCDRCEIAWRILDAQYFGLAQRRARIFLVADFAESERRAGKILFVEPGSCRNNPQSEGTQKRVAGSTADSVGDAGEPTDANSICLRDRAGKPGGGKGPLLSVEKSLTLQANTNDQVLFESHPNDSRVTGPVEVAPTVSARYGTGGNNTPLILNDQGGSVMNVEKDKVGTLRAESHGNNPIVFEPGVATRDGGHIYTNDKSPTLRANPGDNFPTVVYGICSKDSNSMKSANPHSGIYEAEKSRTLDTNGANPNCNQGGNVVVYALEGNGSRPSHRGDGWAETETMYTLNTIERHAVAQPMSTTGGAGLHNEQGKLHDELDGRQGADIGGNGLERRSCSCSGKQTVGSLCAHDGRGFNGQDVAQGKLIIEYETDNDG
jgi:DNA (cytosine-5)-methyltransferase 1